MSGQRRLLRGLGGAGGDRKELVGGESGIDSNTGQLQDTLGRFDTASQGMLRLVGHILDGQQQ
jgi:hypothetical protein